MKNGGHAFQSFLHNIFRCNTSLNECEVLLSNMRFDEIVTSGEIIENYNVELINKSIDKMTTNESCSTRNKHSFYYLHTPEFDKARFAS